MITKEITIRHHSIGTILPAVLQLKAEELDITGTINTSKQSTITLLISGKKKDLEAYIAWCETAAIGRGATVAETRDRAFKAFYNFSRV
ncbi:hypothetical protein LL912_07275 [Niabella sp. CC-SYL272]|uniref:hypothetical protein n=1 Tax=Niabella agricola TaxID=2891571 RepID=UPI001F252701|nr:hypothetical protein [Niabella agricola]MCF3108575.1 hypothetical protein [Niabella agricola]